MKSMISQSFAKGKVKNYGGSGKKKTKKSSSGVKKSKE